jgi:hypothetical protein
MAYTQSDLDSIEQAISLGAVRVRIQGQETEFRTLKEMFAIRDAIRRDVAGPAASLPRRTVAAGYRD